MFKSALFQNILFKYIIFLTIPRYNIYFHSAIPKKCLEVPYFKMFGFKYIILLTILCNLDTTMDGYCLHRTNKAIWNLPLLRQISKKDEN